ASLANAQPAPVVVIVPDKAPAKRSKRASRHEGVRRGVVPTAQAEQAQPEVPNSSSTETSQHRALDEELSLLRGAYDALRAGRPQYALERLAQHAARFPDGELAEAREVARMIALCHAGRSTAARAQAAEFLARAPKSPYAARVRLICHEAVDDGQR